MNPWESGLNWKSIGYWEGALKGLYKYYLFFIFFFSILCMKLGCFLQCALLVQPRSLKCWVQLILTLQNDEAK